MKFNTRSLLTVLTITALFGCKNKNTEAIEVSTKTEAIIAKKAINDSIINNPPKGMVWIPGGTFLQGAVPQDQIAMEHEKPQHPVPDEPAVAVLPAAHRHRHRNPRQR